MGGVNFASFPPKNHIPSIILALAVLWALSAPSSLFQRLEDYNWQFTDASTGQASSLIVLMKCGLIMHQKDLSCRTVAALQ